MNFGRLNIVLMAVLLICVVFSWAAARDFSKPNWNIMPEMLDSIPYDSWSPNPVFADGQTLQMPVEGTIARGYPPLPYKATPEDAQRAGAELTNPYSADDLAVFNRGSDVYASFCVHCHGARGAGDGIVSTRGFPPPPSLLADNAFNMPEGQMFHVITYGQGNMPPHASQITREDRWKVIAFIMQSIQQR